MSTLPTALAPLNNDPALALRVAVSEARDLVALLRDPDFRSDANDLLASRLWLAATTRDHDELTEGIYFARKALNLSCCVCGEEMDVEPSREAQCCSAACYGGD